MFKRLGWTLLVLLPLGGLLAGSALRADYAVRWSTYCEYPITTRLLGWLEGGRQLLLGESKYDESGVDRGLVTGFILLDTATGAVLQRIALPEGMHAEPGIHHSYCRMTADGQVLLSGCPQRADLPHEFQVMRFDLASRKVTQHWLTGGHYATAGEASGTCVGFGYSVLGALVSDGCMLLWRGDSKKPTVVPLDSYAEVGLSPDGLMAHARRFRNTMSDLVLFDVAMKTVIQVIPGVFHEVHWMDGHQSFLAYTFDPVQQRKYCQRYVRQGHEYVADEGSRFSFAGIGNMQHHGCWISHTSSALSQPARKWLADVFGETGKPLLDKLWPHGDYVLLLHPDTGHIVHEYKLPQQPRETILPHPDGLRIVSRGDFVIRLLEFSPSQVYLPVLGFTAGCLPLVLATLWYVRQRKKHATLHSVSS
ncbi:MAG: hypothetical protein U0796_12320 [Gemmatales bacterium]